MVELLNWTSYRGRHHFNFYSKSGLNGYSIFGENSRGKTSFTDAIQWVLYGEAWTKAIIDSNQTETKKRRPIVSADETDDPLLNVHAYREGDFDLMVKLHFDHEGERMILTRIADTDKPRLPTDKNITELLFLHNKTQDTKHQGGEVQIFIDTLLPKSIRRFFFIDGESVNEYRALIASTEENLEIRKNIEDILNFPILKKGIQDIISVKNQYRTLQTKLASDTKKNRNLSEKIKKCDIEISNIQRIFDRFEDDSKIAKSKVSKLESEIQDHSSSEKLMDKRKGIVNQKSSIKNSLDSLYSRRKSENKHLWLYFLQPSLQNKIKEIEPKIAVSSELNHNISSLFNKISHLQGVILEDESPCSQCGAKPHKRDEKGKKQDLDKIKFMQNEMVESKLQLDSMESIKILFSKIKDFKNLNRIKEIIKIENNIGELEGKLIELNDQENEVERLLDGIDEKTVAKLREKLKKERVSVGYLEGNLLRHQKLIDEQNVQKSIHKRNLIGSDGSVESDLLLRKIKSIEWLENIWNNVIYDYSDKTRELIQSRASETFRSLTNNPNGYHALNLNQGFGLRILDSNSRPVASPSPGAQQVAAISLIDALRQTSDIEFPILFDTPGASIDQGHRNNIINHFWSKRDVQLIILAHSGEFRPDEVEKKHVKLLAKTWELKFDDNQNTTTIHPRVI